MEVKIMKNFLSYIKKSRYLAARILFVFLAFGVMITSGSLYVNNMLQTHLRTEAKNMLDQVGLKIDSEFMEPKTALLLISTDIRRMIMDGDTSDQIYDFMKTTSDELYAKGGGFQYDGLFGYFDAYNGLYLTALPWTQPAGYDPTTPVVYRGCCGERRYRHARLLGFAHAELYGYVFAPYF